MIRLRDRASQLETRYSHLQDNAAAQVDELTAKVDELTARRDALQAQLDQAAAVPQQAAPEEKPQPKDAAQLIASRWSQVDGLTATVKGAHTAAHVAAIEAEGGKWSAKRSAYYFRVA
jgi:peptidoglycan hydrolase CwlO-like protein